jgi:hypothetical protein
MKLGFWPRYSHPDPTDLHWPILDNTLLPLFLLAPVVLLVSLILAFRRRFAGRQDWRIFLLTFVSFVILISWLKFDPGGFVEWWLD